MDMWINITSSNDGWSIWSESSKWREAFTCKLHLEWVVSLWHIISFKRNAIRLSKGFSFITELRVVYEKISCILFITATFFHSFFSLLMDYKCKSERQIIYCRHQQLTTNEREKENNRVSEIMKKMYVNRKMNLNYKRFVLRRFLAFARQRRQTQLLS